MKSKDSISALKFRRNVLAELLNFKQCGERGVIKCLDNMEYMLESGIKSDGCLFLRLNKQTTLDIQIGEFCYWSLRRYSSVSSGVEWHLLTAHVAKKARDISLGMPVVKFIQNVTFDQVYSEIVEINKTDSKNLPARCLAMIEEFGELAAEIAKYEGYKAKHKTPSAEHLLEECADMVQCSFSIAIDVLAKLNLPVSDLLDEMRRKNEKWKQSKNK